MNYNLFGQATQPLGFGNVGSNPAALGPFPTQITANALSFGSTPAAVAPAPAPHPTYAPSAYPTVSTSSPTTGVGTAAGTDGTTPADLSFTDRLKSTFLTPEGGFNMNSLGDLAKVIGSFGSLYAGFQQNKLAKDALNFQKQAYQTNLANQISSYNLALEDRMSARYAQNNRSQAEADAKVAQHRLEA